MPVDGTTRASLSFRNLRTLSSTSRFAPCICAASTVTPHATLPTQDPTSRLRAPKLFGFRNEVVRLAKHVHQSKSYASDVLDVFKTGGARRARRSPRSAIDR